MNNYNNGNRNAFLIRRTTGGTGPIEKLLITQEMVSFQLSLSNRQVLKRKADLDFPMIGVPPFEMCGVHTSALQRIRARASPAAVRKKGALDVSNTPG